MRLPHRCTIQKRTASAPDANGESTYSWATDQSAVGCRFYYPSSGEQARRGVSGEAVSDSVWIILPPTVTIARDTYRITTTQAGYAGTYRIATIRPRSGAYGGVDHYEAELAEVQA